jgi:PII-like signaling protein
MLIGESDTRHHKPLSTGIAHRANRAGLAGASVFRGMEGYGMYSHIHATRVLSAPEELPLVVVIVDSAGRICAFLPQQGELITGGLLRIDEAKVTLHVERDDDAQ